MEDGLEWTHGSNLFGEMAEVAKKIGMLLHWV